MSPNAVHKIAQNIRHFREIQTSTIKWALKQPFSDSRKDIIDEVAFWRDVLDYAERKIASGEIRAERTVAVSKG